MKRALEVAVEMAIGATIGLVLGAICAGCAPGNRVVHDGQAQATQIVWSETYQRPDEAPDVLWVEGAELDCGRADAPGFTAVGAGCVGGVTYNAYQVHVAWWGAPYHRTALAHEMAHALQGRWGVLDPTHGDPHVWGTGGLVDTANAALDAQGL